MTDNNFFILIIDLLLALENNDIDLIKVYVNQINEIRTQEDKFKNLIAFFEMPVLEVKYGNTEGFNYILENLDGIPQQEKDFIYWNRKINQLIKNDNEQEIIDFIKEYSSDLTILNSHQKNSLIRLSTKINNFDLLYQIRQSLNKIN